MYKRVLLALDLEGVNYVVGEPYVGLGRDSEQGCIARAQAAKEINAAAEVLFAAGVEKVSLWDNHGGGKNLTQDVLDPRVELLSYNPGSLRMEFAEGQYDCICFFGYHAMEGTLGGVLAHTMNSKMVQFYKLNGRYIGEVDMDAYIAAYYGMPSCFYAGGNIACSQAARAVPGIITVETKQELSRNEAVFRDNEALLAEIKEKIVEAVQTEVPMTQLTYPAAMEKSFKRVEDAAKYLEKLLNLGIQSAYLDDAILGKDAHTVVSRVHDIDAFRKCI